jgi:hypothetical protein
MGLLYLLPIINRDCTECTLFYLLLAYLTTIASIIYYGVEQACSIFDVALATSANFGLLGQTRNSLHRTKNE